MICIWKYFTTTICTNIEHNIKINKKNTGLNYKFNKRVIFTGVTTTKNIQNEIKYIDNMLWALYWLKLICVNLELP